MIWTRRLMRTAFIFLVTMTAPTYESAAEIRTLWIPVVGRGILERAYSLETDGRRLYAGTRDGLYVSLDNGYTWRSTGLIDAIGIIAVSTDAIYATAHGVERGMYRSDDRGETWMPIHNAMPTITSVRVDGSEYERSPYINQILSTNSGAIIAVGYNDGTYISNDRGETWHNPFGEWMYPGPKASFVPDYDFSDSIWSMTEFDGYWWAVLCSAAVLRSQDNGKTWEYASTGSDMAWATDSVVLNHRLYIAAEKHYSTGNGSDKGFFARYEGARHWEVLTQGLPPHDVETTDFYGVPMVLRTHLTNIESLAVNRGRIFAGLKRRGVWVFDERFETWFPVGLEGASIYALVSHQSNLYAATKNGIYRASISVVQPHGKAITTWGAIKQK